MLRAALARASSLDSAAGSLLPSVAARFAVQRVEAGARPQLERQALAPPVQLLARQAAQLHLPVPFPVLDSRTDKVLPKSCPAAS